MTNSYFEWVIITEAVNHFSLVWAHSCKILLQSMKRAKLNELAVTKNISVLSGIVYNLNTSDWPLHSHAQQISLWLATVRNT